ncbi:hypothetical protein [Maliponia aquimaris]|uniref:Type IV pilus biogenesis n=1 Tax=Maliponia aquimaris TaxID=1673631 RepID=A0A238L570_9RHOB|nr:hypothetical protein [Maliponia aquimaris]SMX49542.1 hypothetical protein MAA8898_04335 [Maliponia aquimaris]
MTPNFALSLSFEGITLLRRMGARWARIEEVPLDHPDLDSAVRALRDRAEALDPSGAQVALIIPNEQIRYLDQPDLGGDPATREVAIRAALDGATPYAVRELKFDHVVSGGRLMVAAVAHLTLEEARVFAIEHGFQPVCFLAQAPDGAFDGAVFFGKAKGWPRAVARPARPLEIVEADKAALTPLPPPEAPEKAEAEDLPEAAPAAEPAPAASAAPKAPPAAAAPEARPPAPPQPPAARAEPKVAAPALPGAERGSATPGPARPAPAVTARPATTPPPAAPLAAQPAAPRSAPPVAPVTRPAQLPPKPAPQATPRPAADLPAEPAVTFSTRRAGLGPAPVPGDALSAPAPTAQLKPRFTPVPQAGEAQAPEAPAPVARTPEAPAVARKAEPAAVPAPTAEPVAKRGFFAKSAASALLEQAAAAVDATERAQTAEAPKPRKLALPKRKAAPPKPPGRPLGKPALPRVPPLAAPGEEPLSQPPVAVARHTHPREKVPVGKPNPLARLAALRSAGAPALPAGLATAGGPAMSGPGAAPGKLFNSSTEREQMTVFGARARGPVGGKPRFLGLILTALLLLFLAGVAAWASVFLEDGLARLFRGNDRAEPTVAALPDPGDAPAAPADAVILESASPEAPPAPDAADSGEAPDVQLAAFDTAVETPAEPLAVPVVPRALTSEEAAASYAASGVWQRAPVSPLTPPEDDVDDIYVASIDPDIQMFDAVALPDARLLEREPGFADPGLPPPAGLTFDFDERDLVRATPEGALTPDGLRVFTGRPPAVPPLRNSDDSRAPITDTAPSVAVAQPDAIPRIRPEARPSDVIEQRERVQLGGISRAELARIRPQMRPQTEQEQAQIAAPEATELAVDRSLIPVSRPRNMAAIVDQAEVNPDPVPVQTAAVAPRTVEPTLPSSASVARSATINNAINLNKINLIGVYGTADNRRALVRLASGKYQKVKVGDSLDGGRVSAIGEDELRYQKSGRDLVLKMPRT